MHFSSPAKLAFKAGLSFFLLQAYLQKASLIDLEPLVDINTLTSPCLLTFVPLIPAKLVGYINSKWEGQHPAVNCYGYLAWAHTHCTSWLVQELLVCDSACIRSRAAAALPNSPRKDIWVAVLSLITAYAHAQRLSIAQTKPFVLDVHWRTLKHLAQLLATHKGHNLSQVPACYRCKDCKVKDTEGTLDFFAQLSHRNYLLHIFKFVIYKNEFSYDFCILIYMYA